MLRVLEAQLGRTPAEWLRKVEAATLLVVFAQAFDVEAPSVANCSADEALMVFREFTAACMEAAQADEQVAVAYRNRLGTAALDLGRTVRLLLRVRLEQSFAVTQFLYRGIEIDLSRADGEPGVAFTYGEFPNQVQFGPCSFACRYTPTDCWFMSAFDEGFMRGISGAEEADLLFDSRLTEGAPCCRAKFGME